MSVTWRWGIGLIGVCGFLAGPSQAAAHAGKFGTLCHLPPRARIVVANSKAIVFKSPRTSSSEGGIYGCAFGTRRTYLLVEGQGRASDFGTQIGFYGITPSTLAGTLVAWEIALVHPQSPSRFTIYVRDLRSGALRTLPTGESHGEEFGVGETTDIVLKSDGAIAWIVHRFMGVEVHAADKNGIRVLATGEGIDGESLSLAGSTLYWTQNGNPFSATLD